MWKTIGALALISVFVSQPLHAAKKNGFDLSGSLIPQKEILHGGPPRDGIPSIDEPKFVNAKSAAFLKDNDRILGIHYNGEARAYPIRILNWHEIVNDEINGKPFAVTYCPLCGTGMVFASIVNAQKLTFGVSGLLYNSDVLLYDRETESLWSQILSKGVSGDMKDQALTSIPASHTRWSDWKTKYPDTKVLSTDTGFKRNYSRSPYGDYDENDSIYFPLSSNSRRYHPKERVIGLQIGDKFKAYPFKELGKLNETKLVETFNGKKITVNFDIENRDGSVLDSKGDPLPTVNGFWFAWYAFHPDTEIFQPQDK